MFQRFKNWLLQPFSSLNNTLRLDLTHFLEVSLFFCALLSLGGIVFAIVFQTGNWTRFLRDASITFGLSLILRFLLHRGYVRLAVYGMLGSFTLFATFSAFMGVGVRGTSYGILLLVIILAALYMHRRAAYMMALISSLIGVGLFLAHQAGWMPNPEQPLAEITTWLIQCGYFFLTALILDVALGQIDQAFLQAHHELGERHRAEAQVRALNAELEQRVAERTAQLAASEERYRMITEISSDYVFSAEINPDGDSHTTWVAGAFETIMGYTFEEYQARGGWLSVLHPDDLQQDQRDMARLRQNQPVVTEIRILTKAGETRWIRNYGYPIWDTKAHGLKGIYGAVQDITLRKNAEKALQDAERRYRTLVEQTSVVIYRDRLDVEGDTFYISPQVENLLGYPAGEWMTGERRWQELLHPDDVEHAKKMVALHLATREPFTDVYRIKAQDGRWVWIRDEATIVSDETGQPDYIQGVLIDITEQKQAEQQMAQQATQLMTLYQLGQEIVASLDLEQICISAHHAVTQLMPVQAFLIALVDLQKDEVEDIYLFDNGQRWPNQRTSLAERGMTASVVQNKTTLILSERAGEIATRLGTLHFGLEDDPESVLMVPLKLGGKVLGVLSVQHYQPHQYTSHHIQILENLANQVAIAIDHARLVQSLRLQAIVLDAAANAIVITDREGIIQWINPAFSKLTGYAAEEVLGRNPRILKSGKHFLAFYRDLWDTILNGETWHGEIINQRKDGRVYTEEQWITPVRDDHGEIFRFVAVKQDITARKLAEVRLAASEERYRDFISQSSEGIWRVEHSHPIAIELPEDEQIQKIFQEAYIAESNEAMARMYGYSQAHELLGKSLEELLPVDPHNVEYLRQFIRSGYRSIELESLELDAAGQEKYFMNSIVGVVENGFLIRSWGLQRDITEQKKVEARELRRQSQLEKVIELGKTVTQETDLEKCLFRIYEGVRQGLEFDRVALFLYDEATGLIRGVFGTSCDGKLVDKQDYIDKADLVSGWSNTLRHPSEISFISNYTETFQISPESEMFGVKEHVSLAAWAGEKPVALIAADNLITQRPITPEQLEGLQLFAGYAGLAIVNARWNAELGARVSARTAELEAVNQELRAFSYTIAHDLRAPARAMIGFLGMLEEHLSARVELDELSYSYLRRSQNGARRMGQMIDELLEYTRLGRTRLRRQPVDMHALVEKIWAQQAANPEHRINFTLLPLPSCQGDPGLLEGVWHQLIANAIKFTQNRPIAQIEVGWREQEGKTHYFIHDNGVGFEMQYASKLFGVFQRLHLEDEFEGTGMGLALVKRIIELHGGEIWADAKLEVGATFFFTLGTKF